MPFILAAQRDPDCAAAFKAYRDYLAASAKTFPPSAYSLATSDWYFDFSNDRCPHDAHLQTCVIIDQVSDDPIPPSIKIRLLNAREDGFIEFEYVQVYRYQLGYIGESYGHQDWRYDEFRVSDSGHVIHEIEWCGAVNTGNWLIEASDVIYTWRPK